MRKAQTLKNYGDGRTPVGDVPEEARGRSKKDRKRWCKGRSGREHVTEWRLWDEMVFGSNTPQLKARLEEIRAQRAAERERDDSGLLMYVPCVSEVEVCTVCGKNLRWR